MGHRSYQLKNFRVVFLAVTPLFCAVALPAGAQSAQSAPAPENRPVQQQDEATRAQLDQFRGFMDSHPEIAEQLRRDPSLLGNREFVDTHPALQSFLRDHPGIREDARQDPGAFVRQDDRFDDRGPGDARNGDISHRDLVEFNRFLDDHREVAEQLRKNPSLVDDRAFVQAHPELATYLHDHPGVREEIRQDPNAFMRDEDRMDRNRDAMNQDRDARAPGMSLDHHHDDVANFKGFLGHHPEIARDVQRDPYLCKNYDYVRQHPEFSDYLHSNPEVRAQLMENPQGFVKATQEFRPGVSDNMSGNGNPAGNSNGNWSHGSNPSATPAPDSAPKPKQQ